LFPDAPIVFSTVAAPDESLRSSAPGLTGVLYGNGFGDTLRLALRLHPSTTQVFYVAGASDATLRDSMRAQLRDVIDRVELTAINATSVPSLVAAVKAVPAGSLILYIRYSQDEAGNVLFPADVAPLIAQAAAVPVYGVAESYLGSGVVGGVTARQRVVGTRIAETARKVLLGTRPEDIPIEHPALVPMFDWRQLRRWGIAEGSLPADSIILFREITIWERYRWAIVLTASVLLLQSVLIGGLVFERRRRRRAEVESRRNLAAMAHLDRRAAMGELATSLAHELSQPLNAILQNAGVAQMLLTSATVPPALGEMAEIIGDIRKDDVRASEIIRRMRGLLQKHELEARPVDLNDVAQETVAIVRPDARARAIELEVELAASVRPILGDRVHLQQVLLNLLMNAIDAVAAMPPERRRVRVRATQGDGIVRLAVSDTGPGIPSNRLSQIFEPFYTTKSEGSGMGMGLAIARSIVEAHAGRIAAENNDSGGATVWFTVPVSSNQTEGR
jgi:signal transduction histidine kinase